MANGAKTTNVLKKMLLSYRGLPHKKQYLEFFTALLSIPVLLTVIILNFNSLKNINQPKEKSNPEKIFINVPVTGSKQTTFTGQTPASQGPCKKGIAPISINSPEENESITDNPISIDITYEQGSYCSAVWAYRINGGKWSDYDDQSISLYNPPQGKIKFELKIKSLVTNEERALTRNFVNKSDNASATPTMAQDQLGVSASTPTPTPN